MTLKKNIFRGKGALYLIQVCLNQAVHLKMFIILIGFK